MDLSEIVCIIHGWELGFAMGELLALLLPLRVGARARNCGLDTGERCCTRWCTAPSCGTEPLSLPEDAEHVSRCWADDIVDHVRCRHSRSRRCGRRARALPLVALMAARRLDGSTPTPGPATSP